MTDSVTYKNSASAEVPDFSREKPRGWWDPGRKLIGTIRSYQAASGFFAPVFRRYHVLRHRFWSVASGADIPLNSRIGGGLVLPHPNGVVVHPEAQIGCNCMLFQQVTIAGPAIIGGHVDIGAGARILGPLTIGDHVQIGANAVVTTDLPDEIVATGIPAKIR